MKKYAYYITAFLLLFFLVAASAARAGQTDLHSLELEPQSKTSGASGEDTFGMQIKDTSGTIRFHISTRGHVRLNDSSGGPLLDIATTAAITVRNSSNVAQWSVSNTGVVTGKGVTRCVELPLANFLIATTFGTITTTSNPTLAFNDQMPTIVYADGETTPIMQTFRVPGDYSSGGSFRVFCTEPTIATLNNEIDFDVIVNQNASGPRITRTNQTPVALSQSTGQNNIVTLTPSTDFGSLATNEYVTFRIWRDNTVAATGDLEIKAVEFVYVPVR